MQDAAEGLTPEQTNALLSGANTSLSVNSTTTAVEAKPLLTDVEYAVKAALDTLGLKLRTEMLATLQNIEDRLKAVEEKAEGVIHTASASAFGFVKKEANEVVDDIHDLKIDAATEVDKLKASLIKHFPNIKL